MKSNDDKLLEMYLKGIKKHDISYNEERELLKRIKAGDREAKNILIEQNLKLVIKNAYYYLNHGLELMDLIQEGNIGLIKAIDNFDLSYENKFSTYATHWINQTIKKALINTGNGIKKPAHFSGKIIKIKKMEKYLTERDNEKPSTKKLAQALNISEEKLNEILKTEMITNTISLNQIVNGNSNSDDNDELVDFIDSNEKPLIEIVEEEDMALQINKAMQKSLDKREIQILKLRNGFNNQKFQTLKIIGKQYNITRERVRQIEAKALKKLKKNKTIRELHDDNTSSNN